WAQFIAGQVLFGPQHVERILCGNGIRPLLTMVWFRYGWLMFSRYLTFNHLIQIH
ncbi:hypothetical protein OXX59_010606, partial [Metschnikowia pulcherrima]